MIDLRDCRRPRRSLRVSNREAWRSGLFGIAIQEKTKGRGNEDRQNRLGEVGDGDVDVELELELVVR